MSVAVYDSEFRQLFATAHVIRAAVRPVARNMEHPVASGATVTDFRVIMPLEIDLTLILDPSDYSDVYKQIKAFFLRGELLTVSTKTGVSNNMLIQEMPSEETADKFDTIPLAVRLKRVQFVRAQYGSLPPAAVANKADSSTVDRGVVSPKQGSYILRLF